VKEKKSILPTVITIQKEKAPIVISDDESLAYVLQIEKDRIEKLDNSFPEIDLNVQEKITTTSSSEHDAKPKPFDLKTLFLY
jgi:hypothetical protein